MAHRLALDKLRVLASAGHYSELEAAAEVVVAQWPQSGPAWQCLGLAKGKQGKEALHALRIAAQCLPYDAVAQLNYGNALGRAGRLEQAGETFILALRLRPEFAEAHNNLSDVQLELGNLEEAESNCRRALAIRPWYAEAHWNLGRTLERQCRLDDAVESLRRALQLRPEFAEAHCSLGNALLKLARFDEAITSHRLALQLRPDYTEARVNCASALRRVGRLEEAEANYRQVLIDQPDLLEVHIELGTALRLQRRATDAEASYRTALSIDPNCAAAFTALAQLRADAGRFRVAEQLLKHAISLDSQSADAWAALAYLRRMTSADESWLAGAQRLAEKGLPAQRESLLRYAIGKYFDDIANFELAFCNYRRANELANQYVPFHDRDRLTKHVDLIIKSYDRSWISRGRAAAPTTQRAVFVVGMLRSGTTLVEQILASHPAVFGAGELTFWGAHGAAGITAAAATDASRIEVDNAALAVLRSGYMELLNRVSLNTARVIDKLPTNFLFLGLIGAALPECRVIHMQRDPIDTCLSIYFQHFEAVNTYANDLDDLAHYYREYRRLMQHWRAVLPPGMMLEVPYERLVKDPEDWIRKMLRFIDLPWDPRCLDFDRTVRQVVTASRWHVRQPMDNSSIGRWRRYKKFLGPLRGLLDEEFKCETDMPAPRAPQVQ